MPRFLKKAPIKVSESPRDERCNAGMAYHISATASMEAAEGIQNGDGLFMNIRIKKRTRKDPVRLCLW